MGVRGLQHYLEKSCQPACYNVSIADLIEEHRRQIQDPNQDIIIVVDGSSCIRNLYGELEWIGGGQLKQFVTKAQFFVNQFASLGVRLVFFFDGPTVEKKRKTWIDRRISKLDSMYYVLDKIEQGVPSDRINRRQHFLLPPGMGQLARVIFENMCKCEVFQSLRECDDEIAHYARTKRAFAILSQDSDFVILDKGKALYLSMEKLDLENMTTLLYDHYELADYLKIDVRQLPLLATLMGNDVIDYKEIKPFHVRMMRHRFPSQAIDFRKLIPNLANYIRRLPINRSHLFDMTYELSNLLFGHPERARDVKASIDSYSASFRDNNRHDDIRQHGAHWAVLLKKARDLHVRNEVPSMVYAIMCGLPFESSTSIEDFRKDDLPSFARATEVIRRRIYGILLHEKPLPPGQECHYVPEWCMAGPNSLDNPNEVPAIPAPSRHPGLLGLWNKKRTDLCAVRWEMFVKSVSPNLDVKKVRALNRSMLIPTLVLAFLKELNCLEDWEINAMLATSVCLYQYNDDKLAALPADPMTTRGIRIANLIMRTTFVLYILLAACGYPASVWETVPWRFFDGKLFQIKYNEAMAGNSVMVLCNKSETNRQRFVQAQNIVYRQ